MKSSEVLVVRTCDFCSEKKKCFWICNLCGRDVCDEHRIGVSVSHGVEHREPPDRVRGSHQDVSDLLGKIVDDVNDMGGGLHAGSRLEFSLFPECGRKSLAEICTDLRERIKDIALSNLS